ncbi:hypothetical protein [Nocardiopsis sp. FR26]|uniref:hypothetical protein n=1 Tax=Nocardiopsis sp. FR26 TaxID=2605987 RepID=UPI001358D8AF|nr:hypothetical protein [Nocardiopsis sp. FR26]
MVKTMPYTFDDNEIPSREMATKSPFPDYPLLRKFQDGLDMWDEQFVHVDVHDCLDKLGKGKLVTGREELQDESGQVVGEVLTLDPRRMQELEKAVNELHKRRWSQL